MEYLDGEGTAASRDAIGRTPRHLRHLPGSRGRTARLSAHTQAWTVIAAPASLQAAGAETRHRCSRFRAWRPSRGRHGRPWAPPR